MALTAADPNAELLTKSEAAALLKVSPVTVSRWLKQGRLPAFRLGRRAIRIRRGDIERMLAPIHLDEQRSDPAAGRTAKTSGFSAIDHELLASITPLTEEEIKRGLAAMDSARELRQRMRADRGGRPLPSSWKLIRKEREKR